MSNPDHNPSTPQQLVEVGSALAVPAAGLTTVARYLHREGWDSMSAVDQIPGVDYASSAAGGLAFGATVFAAAERLAMHLDGRGRETAAEKVRRAGKIVAWVGSAACQIAVETNMRGVADKWDVLVGVAATAPGIIAGRTMGKALPPRHQR
jgi:hypothetical protein